MLRPLALGALVLAVPASVPAFDLTGTWTSRVSCTGSFDGAKVTFKDAPSVAITQDGAVLGLRVTYASSGTPDFYTALANPDAKKPDRKGEIATIHCHTDRVAGNQPHFDEIGRLAVATKPGKVKASAKGLSIYSDPGVASPESGRCRWKLTRVDPNDPGVATTCPAPILLRAAEASSHRRRR